VSDAIGAGTAIVYTERGDFPEYPIIVEGMQHLVPSVHVSNPDLMAGRLEDPIRDPLASGDTKLTERRVRRSISVELVALMPVLASLHGARHHNGCSGDSSKILRHFIYLESDR